MASSRLSLDGFRSPADKKQYRLVTLSNGLEVMLIQSEAQTKAVDSESTHRSFTPMDEMGSGKESNNRAPPLAAACLAVDVGSLTDPEELPGLAHYLEHMMFMGSGKYPAEDAFEAFLSAHGGSSNGVTECESTRFLFDVDACYLQPALDMFASLFVAPLLRQEAMEREIKAVESEFQCVRNNDPVRLQQVMCETSVPEHPYARCFTWGNAESLKHKPEQNGIDVRERMVAFFQEYYIASRMKLCVYGCEPLNALEQYVTQSFAEIPQVRPGYEPPSVLKLSVPYGAAAGQCPTLLRIIPVGDKRFLRLYWMLPATLTSYHQKPWRYVAHLLGHESPNSTTTLLKRKQWATDVVTGTSDRDAFEFGSFGAVFEVRVALTEDGLRCWQQVAQVIFDAIHLLKTMAVEGSLPVWVFEELCLSDEMHFQFQEDTKAPATICRVLSERMLPHRNVLSKGDLLRYDVIQGDFDVTMASALLGELSVDNVRVVLQASSFNNELDIEDLRTERWFGTKFTLNALPDSVLSGWSQSVTELDGSSLLPSPNPFMPKTFSLLSDELHTPICNDYNDSPPDLVPTAPSTQLWYKRDRSFSVPKASVSFLLMLSSPSPTTHMLAELHMELVRQRLQHTLEQADAANFDVELDIRDEAIEVVVFGFSDTLPALVRAIMKEVLRPFRWKPSASSDFTLARLELEREYSNATLSPRAKAYELRLQLLESRAVSTNEKLEALQCRIDRDEELASDLETFATTILRRVEAAPVVRCLVIGNMSREAAVSLVVDVETSRRGGGATGEPEMELEPIAEYSLIAPRCHTMALPPTTNGFLVRRRSERVSERNSVVEVYFQIGKVSPADRAYAILLRSLMAQPLFHELRTKQQLGYTISCSIRDTHGVLGLSVTIQSASHAAGAVATKLDSFLHEDFPLQYLRSGKRLSASRFATHKSTLQREFARPDSTLMERSERYWEEIVSGRLEFDLDAQVAAAMITCTRQGLLERYERWLQGGASSCSACIDRNEIECKEQQRVHGPRKLRVHVVGRCSPHKPLEQLIPRDKTPQLIAGDLREFKRELRCHCNLADSASEERN